MSTKYNVVFPLAKRDEYLANETVDFVISLAGKKLVPNSLSIVGSCAAFKDAALTSIALADEVVMDPDCGYHSCFRDFTTEFRDVGLTEAFSYYPRYVKMQSQALNYQDSLGTETENCAEGMCFSETVRRGYMLGGAVDDRVPFAIKPRIAPNKSDQPIAGDQFGALRIRCTLAPNDEVLYGVDAGAAIYKLSDLQVRYETIDDDQSRPPVNMEVYHVARQVIETNNANLSSFVPGLASSVHISFNKAADERDSTKNFLACEPIEGTPLGSSEADAQNFGQNGADRLYYAVNDNDTMLVGFTMESRAEIVHNYLRSWNLEPKAYANVVRRMNRGEAYGIGIPFGSPLDFSQQKFAVEIDSGVQDPTSCYMYFKGNMQM